MSTASMPRRASISARSSSVHGSAPKIPTRSEHAAGSMPRRCISSIRFRQYDGVTRMMRGSKSAISVTCRSVWPPDTGTTVQPSRSAP